MPIDRPDGRHWCDPATATANAEGRWACQCGQHWRKDWDGVWRQKGSDIPDRPKLVVDEPQEN